VTLTNNAWAIKQSNASEAVRDLALDTLLNVRVFINDPPTPALAQFNYAAFSRVNQTGLLFPIRGSVLSRYTDGRILTARCEVNAAALP
jgi:hypothetical protein